LIDYDFYGYLTVRLDSSHRGYRKYFENEYARIARSREPADGPRIAVEIVRRLPDELPDDIVEHVTFKKLFRFHYLVRGIDTDEVTIYFRRHWVDRVYMNAIGVYLQAQVLEPIMYQKFLEHGILFLHAGGVTKDDEGILLPAYGGTGKTTLSMALLNQGYKLLGDDLLLVDVDKQIVNPYPRPLHIFTYNVRNLRGATIPLRYRIAVYLKNVLRFFLERILRNEFLISTRIHADELFEGEVFGVTCPVVAIAFLRKEGPAIEVVTVTESNVMDIAEGIAESADLNDSLWQLLSRRPDLIENLRRRERGTIATLLRKRGLIAYVNTRQLDLDDLAPFLDQILGRESR
jgi:hypothetical protein